MHALKVFKKKSNKKLSLPGLSSPTYVMLAWIKHPGKKPRYTNTDVAWEHFNAWVSEFFSVF